MKGVRFLGFFLGGGILGFLVFLLFLFRSEMYEYTISFIYWLRKFNFIMVCIFSTELKAQLCFFDRLFTVVYLPKTFTFFSPSLEPLDQSQLH